MSDARLFDTSCAMVDELPSMDDLILTLQFKLKNSEQRGEYLDKLIAHSGGGSLIAKTADQLSHDIAALLKQTTSFVQLREKSLGSQSSFEATLDKFIENAVECYEFNRDIVTACHEALLRQAVKEQSMLRIGT